MWTVLDRKVSAGWRRVFAFAVAAGVTGLASLPALGGEGRHDRRHDRDQGHHGRRDHSRHDHRREGDGGLRVDVDFRTGRTRVINRQWHAPRYEERRVRVWVDPVYHTVTDTVWVEPVYKTVCDRVWREPVVRTECERVWVPDCYEWRTVTRVDARGCRVRVRERVLVRRGHFEERHRDVIVRPGFWENVERQELVFEGHWREVERQELVRAGHYAWRTERVRVADGGWRDEAVLGIGIDLD